MYTKSMDISPESSVLHVECSAVVSRMEQVHERTRDYDFWRLMHIECVWMFSEQFKLVDITLSNIIFGLQT